MSDRIPMTRAGYDKIKAELEHLQGVELPKVLEGLAAARAEGDLSENAEYHGRRESHAMLEARIGAIRDKLSRAVLVDPSQFPKDQVSFGCTVVVKDLDFGEEEEFTLVGAGEEDYDAGKILVTSPLAQGSQRQENRRQGGDHRSPRQDAFRDPRDPRAGIAGVPALAGGGGMFSCGHNVLMVGRVNMLATSMPTRLRREGMPPAACRSKPSS